MIAVVGGGLIGACVAFELHQAGQDVVVLDAELPGAAWRAGAGLLTPSGEKLRGTPLEADANQSLGLWPDFARRLEEASGQTVGFREGVYRVAFDDEQAHALNCDPDGQASDCPQSHLSAARFHASEGRVHPPSVRSAALSGLQILHGRTLRIEPLEAGADSSPSARRRGRLDADSSFGQNPSSLFAAQKRRIGSSPKAAKRPDETVEPAPRVRLHLDSGMAVDAEAAVLCCGAWSSAFGLPVRAVQGQALLLDAPRDSPALYGPPQNGSSQYILGRMDGLYVGATSRDAGTEETCPDPDALGVLRDKARRLMGEAVAGAPLLQHLVGFRPTTPDGLPIIGLHPQLKNVVVATGHSRHGVLLAPLTARRVLQLVRDLLNKHPLQAAQDAMAPDTAMLAVAEETARVVDISAAPTVAKQAGPIAQNAAQVAVASNAVQVAAARHLHCGQHVQQERPTREVKA